jgi:hypothetical protein
MNPLKKNTVRAETVPTIIKSLFFNSLNFILGSAELNRYTGDANRVDMHDFGANTLRRCTKTGILDVRQPDH